MTAAHPDAAGPNCGFMFRMPIDPEALPRRIEIRFAGPSGVFSLGGEPDWRMSTIGTKRRRDLPSIAPPVLEPA